MENVYNLIEKEDIEVYTPELTQWKPFLYKGDSYQLLIRTENFIKENQCSYMEIVKIEGILLKEVIWTINGEKNNLHSFYLKKMKGNLHILIDEMIKNESNIY